MALLQYLIISGLLVSSALSSANSDPLPTPGGLAGVVSDPLPTPGGVTFLGVGYDILIGNPEGGDINTGGVDPGLLTTRKIFKLTYEENRLSNDLNYRVPDEVEFAPRESCVSTTSQEVFYGTKSYQEKIGVDIAVSGRKLGIFKAFQFSLSARYQDVRSGTENSRLVYYEERTVCNKGQARFRTEMVQNDRYPLAAGFVADACQLTSTYNESLYMNFIQKWGTHVVTEVDVGTKEIHRREEQQQNFVHYAMSRVQASVSSTGRIGQYSAGVRVDMDVFKESLTTKLNFDRNTYTCRTGSEDMHEPIGLILKSIHEIFDTSYWQIFDDYVTQGKCSSSWILNLATIQSKVELALRGYAAWRNAIESHDPIVQIPVTWPKGTYGLPKPITGCPEDFSEGYRRHHTDNNPGNSCSNHCHLYGSYSSNYANQYFCVKTNENADIYDWTFPPGQYCIFKKGNECPSDLEDGWIYWDDENSGNENSYGGDLPNGDYGSNTKIYYCCSTNGFANNPIYLPVDDNFILIKYNHQCQEVHGMMFRTEWFYWDTEGGSNQWGFHPFQGASGNRIKIQYCHY